MKPNDRYRFAVRFEEQLIRALRGYAPWKTRSKSWRDDPITEGQKARLRNLGVKEMPTTKGTASDIISERMKQKV